MLGGRAKADALYSSVPNLSLGYANTFLAGKTAFAMGPEWFPPQMTAIGLDKKLSYGIWPSRIAVPGVTTKAMSTLSGANVFAVPARSPHPAEAATFAMWMVGLNPLLAWAEAWGQIEPTLKASYDPGYLKAMPFIKQWDTAMAAGYFVTQPRSPVFPVFNTAMGLAVDEVTYLKKTPTQALAEVESKVSTAVQQFQQTHPGWATE
jgi:maltose-binding protein MalE